MIATLLISGVASGVVVHAAGEVPIERDFAVQVLNKDAGLPDTRVLSLLADQRGFLWVGTRKGVSRYDGSHWTSWSRATEPAFVSEECAALAEGPEGTIWVGTGDGLIELGEKVVRHELSRLQLTNTYELFNSSTAVTALAMRGDGTLLVGATHGCIQRTADGNWVLPLGPQGVPVRGLVGSLAWSKNGDGWIGMIDQLYRYPAGSGLWEPQFDASPAPEMRYVHAVQEDGEGTMHAILGNLLALNGSLWRRGPQGWTDLQGGLFHNKAYTAFLARDPSGTLWHPMRGSLLVRVGKEGQTVYRLPDSLDHVRLYCMAMDRDGDLWLGTDMNGLIRLTPRRVEIMDTTRGLPSDSVWALLERKDGSLWAGTAAGVGVQDPKTGRVEAPLDLALPNVRSLAEDLAGRVWIGTGSGVFREEGGQYPEVQLPGSLHSKVRALQAGPDGSMWVATARGVCQLTAGRTNVWVVRDGLPDEDVRVVLPGRHHTWFGTFGGGLARLDASDPKRVVKVPGIPASRVWALHEDADGVLWVGTDQGLYCLAEDQVLAVTTSHGLPVNLVNSIVEDAQGWLWVGHDLGVYRAARLELLEAARGRRGQVRCVPYDETDGLKSPETNGQRSWPPGIRLGDGRVAFATEGGVALFDGKALPDLREGPVVLVERVRASGRTILSNAAGRLRASSPEAGELRVDPALRGLVEVEFTAISFRSPGRVRFRHRLLGLSADWVEDGGQRQATYANLHPGSYTLEVAAANHQGYWSVTPVRLTLRVEPHWYERALYQAVGLAAVLGGLGAALLGYLRAASRRHAFERQAALARERTRLARDLHDSLGANLTEITLLSRTSRKESLSDDALHSRLERLSNRTQEAVRTLRDLIWSTTPTADSLENLVSRVCDSAQQVIGAAGIRCRLEIPDELPQLTLGPERRKEILLACNEAVNNAVRHSQATEIWVRFALDAGVLVIRVEDNGRGFDPEEARAESRTDSGLGLPSLHERMAAAGGTCGVDSRPGSGTRVMLRVPVQGGA